MYQEDFDACATKIQQSRRFLEICFNDANIEEVKSLKGGFRDHQLFDYKACVLAAVGTQDVKCLEFKVAAPLTLKLLLDHDFREDLVKLFISATHPGLIRLLAEQLTLPRNNRVIRGTRYRSIDSKYLTDDYVVQYGKMQIDAILDVFPEVSKTILSRALKLGMIDRVVQYVKSEDRTHDLMAMFVESFEFPTIKAHNKLKKVIDKSSSRDRDISIFSLRFNPWVFAQLLTTSVPFRDEDGRFLYHGDGGGDETVVRAGDRYHHTNRPGPRSQMLKVGYLDQHFQGILSNLFDSQKSLEAQQFLFRCAMVVKLARMNGKYKRAEQPITHLDRFLNTLSRFATSSSDKLSTHWLVNIKDNHSRVIETLSARLPKDLVALVLDYLVGDGE